MLASASTVASRPLGFAGSSSVPVIVAPASIPAHYVKAVELTMAAQGTGGGSAAASKWKKFVGESSEGLVPGLMESGRAGAARDVPATKAQQGSAALAPVSFAPSAAATAAAAAGAGASAGATAAVSTPVQGSQRPVAMNAPTAHRQSNEKLLPPTVSSTPRNAPGNSSLSDPDRSKKTGAKSPLAPPKGISIQADAPIANDKISIVFLFTLNPDLAVAAREFEEQRRASRSPSARGPPGGRVSPGLGGDSPEGVDSARWASLDTDIEVVPMDRIIACVDAKISLDDLVFEMRRVVAERVSSPVTHWPTGHLLEMQSLLKGSLL